MFKNRIRLPITFSKPQFPTERNQFRLANGSTKTLSAVVRNTYEGKTDHLPEDWHRKLAIALNHDEVNIEDSRLLTDIALDGDYVIDWQDFLNNPVAQSTFVVQVTPFNATNSNCQSCEEIAQLNLVDDTTELVFDENTEYDYPFSVLLNDEICCFPFVVELASFNTLYLATATINQAGILTFTTLPSLPILDNVLLATYRVTCDNGGYDEANIYGNIEGTSTECLPVTDLQVVLSEPDNTFAQFLWTATTPAPGIGYEWFLYLQPDIYTAVQSGTTTDAFVYVSGLVLGETYLLAVRSLCSEGNSSDFVTLEFYVPTESAENCGNFNVTFIPPGSGDSANVSYMDCAGAVQNFTLVGIDTQDACMLMDPATNIPIFFASGSAYISYTYLGPC